ncbi:5-oxoprolinase subunit PxpB [Dietzia lutea]|uniref:Carboxyltransferase domain-containing protein n=1 Tax=Dietzia lutea TaxID=546160 RepID=A0A2S1R3L3_9ACTN|nr:5-oxoprolinase subunit PxpB [Dietzia lutea]AWH90841.1 hypothetical protein A6035_00075 [Dietzia lutea]
MAAEINSASPTAQVLPYGPAAHLIEVADTAAATALAAALRAAAVVETSAVKGGLAGRVVDIVPAARTVLVTTDGSPAAAAAVRDAVDSWSPADLADIGGRLHEIPVIYDGPDLEAVADATGMASEDVVAAHAGAEYTVAFGGFSPGFCYLTGLPPVLHLPRRPDPRTEVPTGSVGVAGEFSAVYPRPSPGGWNLIGTAQVPMWDSSWERPNLLAPGDTVRFVPCQG